MRKILLTGLGSLLLLLMVGCSANKAPPSLGSEITGNNPTQDQLSQLRHSSGLDKPLLQRVFDDIFSKNSDPVLLYSAANMGPTPTPTVTHTLPAPLKDETQSVVQVNQNAIRLIVRTGSVQMVVNQISVAIDGIKQISSRYGGYIVSSQQWKEGDRNIGSISIRVLAENYDQAITDIKSLGKSVTNEATNSQDVTEEYTDLNAKVKNLQTTESQLQKIMETAAKTEDILAIQRELTNVRGQIDQAKGRMQYLQRTSATSLMQARHGCTTA